MMAIIDGEWDCVQQSPTGERKSVLTLVSSGAGNFTGRNVNDQGAIDVTDGKIDGSDVSFQMQISTPMKITLKTTATLEGDTIEGKTVIGIFGKYKMKATRRS